MHLRQVTRFPEDRARFYAIQVAMALGHLHSKNIIYRDLKPENILMDEDGYICLTDFGLAKVLEGNAQAFSFCGTPDYLAPEILVERGHSFPVDWWALGVLIFEMLAGEFLFIFVCVWSIGLTSYFVHRVSSIRG